VQVNLVSIRDCLLKLGHYCGVINLTRHRKPEADEVYYPESAAAVIQLLFRLRTDIIHQHIGGDLTLRLVALGAFCSHVPWAKSVLTFHSGGYPSSDEGRALTRGSLKARLLRQFDSLIAVNDEIREFFLRCGVRADRIRVISPYSFVAPSTDPLRPDIAEFMTRHRPVFLTIGLLEPEYDLPLQIDVIERVLGTHEQAGLIIIGSGSLEDDLRRHIASKPYADHILLAGDVPHAMTLRALAEADVCLRTTLYDGDALSVREALNLGVPVIGTRTVLRPAGVHLIPIHDIDALHGAMLRQLANPQPRTRHETAGETDNIRAVVDLYEELLRG
jgi:glycosyltransferase involved in cell wall biosynthesis